jgi:signal transduction histidine kinase
LNYFNYFTEIEDTFIRRRGKHLWLSPMDWSLMESWKEMGIPLHVALRGIERAFDSFEAKPRRRSVKSLLYCQEEVEAQFLEWQEAQVGAALVNSNGDGASEKTTVDASLPFPRAVILEHLERARASLSRICDERKESRADDFCDALSRAASRLKELGKDFASAARPDAEKLEESLTSLEKMLDEALRLSISSQELAAARFESEEQLQPYRSRMERAVFEQTLDNLLLKRLRDAHGLPRLSLFYL